MLDDADIEAASSAGAWGAFLHQGQICLSASRHIGGHVGGVGQLELWTEWQWVTARDKAEPFPF